ncbi:hypothetical protein MSBR3_1111 [Methanosarcina barkeri 3]|uniref:NACHT domain-containing protein n=1 Tax=Methanosarcina barkeri 3 TaxID=1434107 RepID=A0A0E3WV73_METBA|nr:NACHT domain-containing protein [Methanosarcina barkeri]AKB81689.1 hypothetical protein MSBR3_1111 [Methanosarcina barkeri 3]
MDLSFIQDISLGLFVNGLSYLIGYSSEKINGFLFEKEEVVNSIIKETSFESILEEIISEEEIGKIKRDDIYRFLKSPEVESIVRQIYAVKMYPLETCIIEKNVSFEDIKKEFNLLFSQYIGTNEKNDSKIASKIFTVLITGCEITLDKAINMGELSAHEAKSKYRFKILTDQLDTVNKNIEFLSGRHQPSTREIHRFIEKYCEVIKKRFEIIRSESYTNIRPFIDDIYVCPNFLLKKEMRSDSESDESLDLTSKYYNYQGLINIDQLLPNLYRVVLLGDPGAGKSTFAQKISYDIVTKSLEKVCPGNCDVPIIVTLREYQIENSQNGVSILDFIKKEAHSYYQLINVPNCTFEYLLLNGHALLIFDGLDELLDTRHRARIIDEIESFCTIYPSVPVLVTSRKVGYEQVPLRDDMFQKIELAPFDNKQVEEYVNKWFSLDPDLTLTEKEKKVESFLRESRIVSDIRSNSLMLSLMCSIYREENYIPANRPEVYKKCSEMLFEKWDKTRGISPSILISRTRIKPLVSYLAYTMFTNESLQKGMIEDKLIDKTKEYLLDKLYENEYEAEEAAKDFISFCRGRAWILTDTGTTKRGENIYQFTHRTFLEYFTADWIVRKYDDKLCEVLLPKICKGEWDNVAQLAFQVRYEKSEDGDKLFIDLLQEFDKVETREKFNLVSFASRCLGFIVPNPKITREIITVCFNFSIDFGIELLEEEKAIANIDKKITKVKEVISPMELIYNIENSMIDNRKVIGDTIENLLVNNICEGTKNKSILSLEICLNLEKNFFFFSKDNTFRKNNPDFWDNLKNRTLERCSDSTKELIKEELGFGIEFYRMNKISIEDIVNIYGFRSLFYDYKFTMLPRMTFSGIFSMSFGELIRHSSIDIKELGEIGRLALLQPVHCLELNHSFAIRRMKFELKRSMRLKERRVIDRPYNIPMRIYKKFPKDISLRQIYDSLFGTFVILAYFFEILMESHSKEEDAELESYITGAFNIFGSLKVIYLTRLGRCTLKELNIELNTMEFTHEQRIYIEKWAANEIHLVKKCSQEILLQ